MDKAQYERMVISHTRLSRDFIMAGLQAMMDTSNPDDIKFDIEPDDFEWVEGQWTIDSMDPLEWAEAMELS